MLFCLLEYQQMFKHMENIWEKNASLFLTMKGGGGGGGGGEGAFSLLTLSVWWGGGGGGSGKFLSALKKFSARKGVNNYK